MSEGIGGHEVLETSKKASGAAPALVESFAGLTVPGGSGRHQLSIPSQRGDGRHCGSLAGWGVRMAQGIMGSYPLCPLNEYPASSY